jgi:hypothetical protein
MTTTITVESNGYYEVNGMHREPTVSLYVIPAASKLRRVLRDTNDLIVCPGVYDGLSARIAIELGFKGLYMVRIKTPYSAGYSLIKNADRRRDNSFQTRDGRSRFSPTPRHAYQR